MKIIDVHADNGECTVTTTDGRFTRWPGRTVNGHAWWTYTPDSPGHGMPQLVTVADTVQMLEAQHRRVSPPVRHLRAVNGAA